MIRIFLKFLAINAPIYVFPDRGRAPIRTVFFPERIRRITFEQISFWCRRVLRDGFSSDRRWLRMVSKFLEAHRSIRSSRTAHILFKSSISKGFRLSFETLLLAFDFSARRRTSYLLSTSTYGTIDSRSTGLPHSVYPPLSVNSVSIAPISRSAMDFT